MDDTGAGWRRALARELTARARASAREIMDAPIAFAGPARRIGVTGPPGAGKSSLIATLARQWANARVGVIAIDPTSPVSGGSLLGDRIRMESIAENPNLFIRSLASGSAHDGLCPNILALLDAFEQAGFEHLILETVGVGQVSYEAKSLVDTFVLVLVPESGDTVQAMKAGILELADIYVVNKADLPGAAKLAAELRATAGWRGRGEGWIAPVILTSATENKGAAELAEAIEAHRRAVLDATRLQALTRARRDYHLRSSIAYRIEEILDASRQELEGAPPSESFRFVIDRLR
jgi:LAO/AO transport system kinase